MTYAPLTQVILRHGPLSNGTGLFMELSPSTKGITLTMGTYYERPHQPRTYDPQAVRHFADSTSALLFLARLTHTA